jgi:hypothetical protein
LSPLARVRLFRLILAGVLILLVGVCWIVPARLSRGGGSRYTFAYIGDEHIYAQRILPIASTTDTNPTNGVCDPKAISPYFLEDACRGFLRLTGMDVIDFVWAWRVAMPIALMLAFLLLAQSCLPRRRRPFAAELRLAAAAAGFALLFFVYDLTTTYPPCHGYLDRFPSNIEYPLSVFFAALCVRFLDVPNAVRGIALALTGAGLIYLRPYAALPWGLAAGIMVVHALWTRSLSWRVLAVMIVAFAMAVGPWVFVNWNNSHSGGFADLTVRYFELPGPGLKRPYQVHPQWPLYLSLAGVLLAAMPFSRLKIFTFSCASVLAALPFISGLFSISAQLVGYDRYGVFYLIALLTAAMLVVGRRSVLWRGKQSQAQFARWALGAIALAFAGGGVLAYKNITLNFAAYPGGTFPSVVADQCFLPAYRWVRQNTPPAALFIVDDGYDWSQAPQDLPGFRALMTSFVSRDDLFQIVARRRVVYTDRLYFNILSTDDVERLALLHRGTFGLRVPKNEYLDALKRYHPQYIFWRKTPAYGVSDAVAPIPRGYGKVLEQYREIVFYDEFCEIWKLRY